MTLKIDYNKVSPDIERLIRELLEKIGDQPDHVIHGLLSPIPAFQPALVYKEETVLDQIDEVVCKHENQLRLLAAWEEYEAAQERAGQQAIVPVNLSSGVIEDGVIHLSIKLDSLPYYKEALNEVQRRRDTLWRIWGEVIPQELVPTQQRDRLLSGGTRGTIRRLPKWEYRAGKIICRRGE